MRAVTTASITDSRGYPANDLSRYANIPVPTSYMAIGSSEDFFGGYDHRKQARSRARRKSPHCSRQKAMDMGQSEFGHTWERNLTDQDGPYIELMAGVYTDNQPDFLISRCRGRREPSNSIGIQSRKLDRHIRRIEMRQLA